MQENQNQRWGGTLGPRLPGISLVKPPEFIPLRLILMPTGLHIDLVQTDQVVGRHSQADVRIPLADVSRRHCRFAFQEGRWQVNDLNSTNGTFVNEQQVQEANLKDGDRIRIGSFTFEVHYLPVGTPVGRPVEVPGIRQTQPTPTLRHEQRKAG